jgi:hypothetical protein
MADEESAVSRAIGALADALDEYRSSKKDDEEDEEISEDETVPREKQPRTTREAAIRVREHFRRARKAAVAAENQ